MKALAFFILAFGFYCCNAAGAPAAAAARLTDNQRLNRLETEMNRINLHGSFDITGDSYYGKLPGYSADNPQVFPKHSGLGISQQLGLELSLLAAPALEFYASAHSAGYWGSGLPSDGNIGMPGTSGIPNIDQAYFRYCHPRFLLSAGRQYFSLGPFGLIADNALSALDCMVVNSAIKNASFTGIFARLSTEYYYGTPYAIQDDDYYAFRFAKPFSGILLGGNILAGGLSGEQAGSLDMQFRIGKCELSAEAALYRPSVSFTGTEFRWHTGIILEIVPFQNDRAYFAITAGYLEKGFTPTFSSAAFSAPDAKVKFYHNTSGLDLLYQCRIGKSSILTGEYVGIAFLNKEFALENEQYSQAPQTQITVKVTRHISENTRLETAYHYYHLKNSDYSHLSGGVMLSF
ncbi:MAG: hypothetical protein ACM3WV_05420 [Bacillota bacterium]